MRNQIEHRIFRLALLVNRIFWIRNQEATRSANGRLLVADRALVAIKAGAQPEELVSVARFGSSPVSAPSVTSLQVSQTDSSWTMRFLPSVNKASSLTFSLSTGPPASRVLLRQRKEGTRKCHHRGMPQYARIEYHPILQFCFHYDKRIQH
jgi:hypothetical protein